MTAKIQPERAERFTDLNKMYSVAFCWIIIATIVTVFIQTLLRFRQFHSIYIRYIYLQGAMYKIQCARNLSCTGHNVKRTVCKVYVQRIMSQVERVMCQVLCTRHNAQSTIC